VCLCAVVTLVAAGACKGRGGGEPPPLLSQGDTVQIAATHLGPGWHAGTVGTIGDCTALLVPTPPPPAPPVRFTAVPLDSVTALRKGPDLLPIDALRRAYGNCSPF
jgi:hypothetical protein